LQKDPHFSTKKDQVNAIFAELDTKAGFCINALTNVCNFVEIKWGLNRDKFLSTIRSRVSIHLLVQVFPDKFTK